MMDLELEKPAWKVFCNILAYCLAFISIGGLFGGILGQIFFPYSNIDKIQLIMGGYSIGLECSILFILFTFDEIKYWRITHNG